MIPIIRFARVHDPDTADARQLALALGTMVPTILDPGPVLALTRAGDDPQRVGRAGH